MMNRQLLGSCVLSVGLTLVASAASAQQQTSAAPPQTQSAPPSTSTTSGDTGLWYVPTANVLPNRMWSFSLSRLEANEGQGFSNISTFPISFGIGLGGRTELFVSWDAQTRIDRDSSPLFFPGSATPGTGGGIDVNHPLDRGKFVHSVGDAWIGAKFALSPPSSAVKFALRPMVKLPTGSSSTGTSSGKADFAVDIVGTTELSPVVELSAYGGVIVRGQPAGYSLTNGFRWGAGIGLPSRSPVRFTAEIVGEKYFNGSISAPAGLVGADGSVVPTSTTLTSPAYLNLGLTYQAANGFFFGVGANWNVSMASRASTGSAFVGSESLFADAADYQVRLGFHPGRERHAVAPPPAPGAPNRGGPGGPGSTPGGAGNPAGATPPGGAGAPPAGAAATTPAAASTNRPPTVKAMCDPCTVEVGKTSTVSADAQDPDGDPLTYRWTAPAGTFATATSRQTPWTAPMVVGPVVTTVTVDDGHGHTASDSVTIQVIRPVQKEIVFEDVYFDFDRSSLRPEAQRILDEAVAAMSANPTLQITIEGYTCNIGTAEYNLALGERRAKAVRDYLVGKGVGADRLRTVSYGEERPKFDNSREETRRLNRRAALVVRLTGGN
jgi:peptidoglycan-associated lipoprotein